MTRGPERIEQLRAVSASAVHPPGRCAQSSTSPSMTNSQRERELARVAPPISHSSARGRQPSSRGGLRGIAERELFYILEKTMIIFG